MSDDFTSARPAIDLVGVIETLHRNAALGAALARPVTQKVNGREYLIQADGEYDEVTRLAHDEAAYLEPTTVLDCESIVRWAKGTGAEEGEVVLSRTGTTIARTPRRIDRDHAREVCHKPFFSEYLPPGCRMSYAQLRAWIAVIGDGMKAPKQTKFNAQLDAISVQLGDVVKITKKGGAMSVKREGSEEVGSSMPREIVATVPFGDPPFETDVTFALTAWPDREEGVLFEAVHVRNDKALDRYLSWADEHLRKGLPKGWHLFRAP